MNTRSRCVVAMFLACLLSAPVLLSQSASALFEQGLIKENAEGTLDEAIAIFNRIAQDKAADPSIRAKAQLHIGICYEKLGNAQARGAYERVIADFPQQASEVATARARLVALRTSPRDVSPLRTVRLVWSGPEADIYGTPSPDGRYLSFTDWSTGDLAVRDLESGKNRRLTNKGPWDKSTEEVDYSTWSPDGTQLAFEWETDGNRRLELRVIGLEGSGVRTLYRTGRDEWAKLYGWSPDGKRILASLPGHQFSLISLADGTTTTLKSLELESTRAAFSPDGRYIVFDAPQAADPLRRDIYTLSVADKRELPLVVHSADDRVLGWAPDGQAVLFNSDRTGSGAFWAIPVADGRPQGAAQMIMPVSNRTVPLGFTRDGRFFYGEVKGGSDIYGVTLDAATGKILGPPERIIDRFEGFNLSPSYSPDGEHLAYCSWRGSHRSPAGGAVGIHGNVLCIRSVVTGQEQEFSKAFSALAIDSITGPRWAPDGKSILVYGYAEPMGGYGGVYVVDLQQGSATRVAYSSEDVKVGRAEWLSDGKTIAFFRWDKKAHLARLVARNLETGDEKVIREWPESANPDLAVSLDYRRWCISAAESDGRVFWIMNATGGEPRRLQGAPGFRTWSADGRYILYTRRTEDAKWQLWRVAVDGGAPEPLGLTDSVLIAQLSASPDGRRVAFSRAQLGGSEVWVTENFLPAAKKAR